MQDPEGMEIPPSSVALLARALFSLDALMEARSTLLSLEPRAEPDAVWTAANLLFMRAQLITELMEPLLHDEQALWDAIRWIREAGQKADNQHQRPQARDTGRTGS